MATMDIFNADAFGMIEMTRMVNRFGYVPTFMQSIPGLVEMEPIRTERVFIESSAYTPAIISVSERGAPPKQEGGDVREVKAFKTFRWDRASRITASELAGIRAWGSTTEFRSLQDEIARRTFKMKNAFSLTKEAWLINMIQGLVKDGSTVLYNWWTEFGQSQEAEVAFDFGGASPDIFNKCQDIIRTTTVNLKGLGNANLEIWALCGDEFFKKLRNSTEVKETFQGWQDAALLRNQFGRAWASIDFGNIRFVNYRGTDDGTTVVIPTDKAKFFPVNAGIFKWVMAPGETFDSINAPGLDMYSMVTRDVKRNSYVDIEYYSYPLPVCIQPAALMAGRAGA
jgi:hypothetical protein